MSSSTYTFDDLSFGLDLVYTPILQQNQTTTNGERTSRWLDENTMASFSKKNSDYFSMAADVLDEFVVPPMIPSSSTSTTSTATSADMLPTDLSSVMDDYFVEQGPYQESNATTPATSSTIEHEFINDQSLFPPLYDNNNLHDITAPNSVTAATDTTIMTIVSSPLYSQHIISPTLQFLDENNPSPHQNINIQAFGGLAKNSQEQIGTDASYNTSITTEAPRNISSNDNHSSAINSLALRRQSRQRHEQQRRRRCRNHGRTNRHFFRSYNRPLSTIVPAPSAETLFSKTNNRCDICHINV
ncbi:hypothetical protein INT45_013727 [Circinella minor]|uniref:Uncharacterized protein n=1 Tax=Circinella minor TaxID=1195481 RepID=A0A8H7SCB7_9FUNG|nr:hypothetical protein INT45_013727 [Circinella minor]